MNDEVHEYVLVNEVHTDTGEMRCNRWMVWCHWLTCSS